MHQISLFSYPQNPKAAVFNSDPSIHLRGELPREAGVRKAFAALGSIFYILTNNFIFVQASAGLVHIVPWPSMTGAIPTAPDPHRATPLTISVILMSFHFRWVLKMYSNLKKRSQGTQHQ